MKKYEKLRVISSSTFILFLAISITAQAASLVSHWSMDDNAADSVVVDNTGSYHGTFIDPTDSNTSYHHNTECKEGIGALTFDGVNDYITLPRSSVLETGNTVSKQLSVSAWIKDASGGASGYGTIIGTGDGGWVLARDGDHIIAGAWLINLSNAGDFAAVSSSIDISDGEWHHVAMVYTSTMLFLYVNGERTTVYTRTMYIRNIFNNPVLIGENAHETGRYWNGLIDDVKLYDYALSSDQINAEIAEDNYHLQNPDHAWNPSPFDDAKSRLGIDLSWSAGDSAVSHDIYFGTSESAVTNAQRLAGDINGDGPVNIDDLKILASQWIIETDFNDYAVVAADWGLDAPAEFKGNQSITTYDPGTLEYGTTYYWRADEVNTSEGGSPWTGRVWNFKPVVKIMPLGDSITYDNFSNDPSVDPRPSTMRTGYRSHLWSALEGAGYPVDFVGSVTAGENVDPAFDPDNEGHPGWRDDQVADYVYGWLESASPDIILLHIGTNGLTTSPDDVEDILDEIDRYESDYGTHITVILAKIINRMAYSSTTTIFNTNVANMALTRINGGDDIIIVDMENGAGIIYSTDMVNDLHPNDAGYQKMANLWFSTLQTILPAE